MLEIFAQALMLAGVQRRQSRRSDLRPRHELPEGQATDRHRLRDVPEWEWR